MDSVGDAALHQQLGRIEGKLDALTSSMSRAHLRIDEAEKRIAALEQGVAKIAVWASLIATSAASVIGVGASRVFGG